MKNLVDFLRYVKGIVFPGKEFMISKYQQNQEPRTKTIGKTHHIITSSHQNIGGCGILIVGGRPCGRC